MLIIGYTSGIGKCIYDKLDCQGVGKEEGCDISTQNGRKKVLELCATHEVIIINAFDKVRKNSQLEMFFNLYNKYKDTHKTLIVIGSCSQDRWNESTGEYQSYKQAIDYATMNTARHRNKCRIINIRLGHTATLANQKPNRKHPSIDPYSVPTLIVKLLEMPKDMIPASITILPSVEGVTNAVV